MMTQTVHIVTANALLSGEVVYLTAADHWSADLQQARAFADKPLAEAASASAARRVAEVVGCYVTDMRQTAQGLTPTHFREDFRRRGPSNHAHGKQAQA